MMQVSTTAELCGDVEVAASQGIDGCDAPDAELAEVALGERVHPYANLFPMMSDTEIDELADDIRQHGLREPIVVHRGAVLDGRNRLAACRRAGITPLTIEYDGPDDGVLSFVISCNLRRRHLTDSQRAHAAGKLATMRQGERTDLEPSANLRKVSQRRAAELMRVSERSAASAAKVLNEGIPELNQAVERDEVSVAAAAGVATLPKAEQKRLVDAGPQAIKAAAKNARAEKGKTGPIAPKAAPSLTVPDQLARLSSLMADLLRARRSGQETFKAAMLAADLLRTLLAEMPADSREAIEGRLKGAHPSEVERVAGSAGGGE